MRRRTMRSWIACAVLVTGCVDTVNEPAGEPIELTTPAPETVETAGTGERADVFTMPDLVELAPPQAKNCEQTTLIGAPDLANTEVGEPVMTEHFNADGCVAERWTRDWDGATPLTEDYDWFDPSLAQNVYVAPFAYHHEWTYDEAGQLIGQRRASREDDANHSEWIEETDYDGHGRITRQKRSGSPFQPVVDWTHEDQWTYGPNSDEFETHTTISNGEVYTITRHVYTAAGELIEKHITNAHSGQPEHMIHRRELDAEGRLVLEETWDPTTGAALTRAVFERRADGTLRRKVSKHLQFGWLDVTTFDSAERQLVYTQDEDDDGVVEYHQENRYDTRGNLVFTSTEYDFDRPQTRYSQVVATFDSQDRLLEQISTPTWMDGGSRRVTNVYDTHGAGYSSTLDILDAQGRLERTERVTRLVAPDRVAWERYDLDHDGTLDNLTLRRWVGERPLETLMDHDDDGIIDAIEQWHYDAVGQLVQHVRDDDADTIIDYRELHAR